MLEYRNTHTHHCAKNSRRYKYKLGTTLAPNTCNPLEFAPMTLRTGRYLSLRPQNLATNS